jgi:simple sugar transport system permease protein
VSALLFVLFGVLFALWYALTDTVPTQLPQVTPHIMTLVVLVFAVRRLRMPAADGAIYSKGEGQH